MLNSIGFVWDEKEYEWKVWFEAVKSFKEEEGRWPREGNEEDKREVVLADGKPVLRNLAEWMTTQKMRRDKLNPLWEEKLNSIGFVWDNKEFEWNAMLAALKSFKDKEGRWPRQRKAEDKREVVLADGKPVLRDLAKWMSHQKTAKSNGKLDPLREEKLREIGIVWDEKEYNWKAWFDVVKCFKDKEGRWPRNGKAEDKRKVVLADGKPVLRDLAQWMSKQKRVKSNGKLDRLREEKLEEIDFPFHNRKKRKREADSSSSSTTCHKKKRTISDYL
eukprot:g541.t1